MGYESFNIEEDKSFIRQDADYHKLLAFQKAECIYDITYYFVHKFLQKVDRKDNACIQVAYQFYRMSGSDTFSVPMFLSIIHKEEIIQSRETILPDDEQERICQLIRDFAMKGENHDSMRADS